MICSVCLEDKPIRARSMCSTCYNKWYYENNKEYHREKFKKWIEQNRDYNKIRNMELYERN